MSLAWHSRKAIFAALGAAALLVAAAGCGREEAPDLVNGKALFVQKCGSCHILDRAATQGRTGPSLDAAFAAARRAGMTEKTLQGVVEEQILNPRKSSEMPAELVTGDDARDVAAYVAEVAAEPGEDQGQLAQAGTAGVTDGKQLFTAAGCGSCHTLADAGSNGDAGPNLNDLAANAARRKGGQSAEEYVRESILEPNAFIVSGFQADVMPSYEGRLQPRQVDALVEYLLEAGGG